MLCWVKVTHKRPHIVCSHLYEMSERGKSIHRGWLGESHGSGRNRRYGDGAWGFEVCFWDDENVLELDTGGSCITW